MLFLGNFECNCDNLGNVLGMQMLLSTKLICFHSFTVAFSWFSHSKFFLNKLCTHYVESEVLRAIERQSERTENLTGKKDTQRELEHIAVCIECVIRSRMIQELVLRVLGVTSR